MYAGMVSRKHVNVHGILIGPQCDIRKVSRVLRHKTEDKCLRFCAGAEHLANPWGVNVFTLEHARIN